MTQETRTEIYRHKKAIVKAQLQHALEETFKENWNLEDGAREIWIDGNFNLVAPFEGFCIFNPLSFSFQDYKDETCPKKYNLDNYLEEVENHLTQEECDITMFVSLEDYYEEVL